jgi:hypothetical protein
MTTYSENNLLNSELAVVVLKRLRKETSYGSQISKEIEKPQTSIDRVIQGLYEHNLIREGKRTRAQFYKFDPLLLGKYWFESIRKESRKVELDEEKYRFVSGREMEDEDINQIIQDNEDKITEFGEIYLNEFFLRYFKEAKLREVLFKSPYSSLNWYSRKNNLPDYLAATFLCLESKINLDHSPPADDII